ADSVRLIPYRAPWKLLKCGSGARGAQGPTRKPSENPLERRVDAFPLGRELLQDQLAVGGQTIETLIALLFLAPFADQQALALQPAQQRIQSAFIDLHALLGKRFAQGVAIAFVPQFSQHRQDQAAAPEFKPQVFENFGVHRPFYRVLHSVWHTLYAIQYLLSRIFYEMDKRHDGARQDCTSGTLAPDMTAQVAEIACLIRTDPR